MPHGGSALPQLFLALMSIACIAVVLDIHQNTRLDLLGAQWVLWLLLAQLPYMCSLLLPTATFFAWVYALSEWGERRLILVLNLCGIGRKRLLGYVGLQATCIVACVILCQWQGPQMSHWVEQKASKALLSEHMQHWPAKTFIPLGKRRVLYAHTKVNAHTLQDIWVLEVPSFKSTDAWPLVQWIHAHKAIRDLKQGWRLESGQMHRLNLEKPAARLLSFDTYVWAHVAHLQWKHWLPSFQSLWHTRHDTLKARQSLYWWVVWASMAWVLCVWALIIAAGFRVGLVRNMLCAFVVYGGFLSAAALGASAWLPNPTL